MTRLRCDDVVIGRVYETWLGERIKAVGLRRNKKGVAFGVDGLVVHAGTRDGANTAVTRRPGKVYFFIPSYLEGFASSSEQGAAR